MVTSICPDRDDLRSFHLGMLDERREQEVLDHLNDCQSCEDTVANLEGTSDSLVVAVRGSVSSEPLVSAAEEERPALQQALAEIEGFIDPPPQQPSGPNGTAAASPVSERIRDYELLGTLGEGGMGTVYRARHTRLDRQVALKLLPARRLRDNAAVARFEREMKAIGRLDHPTIVRATDAGDVDGTHFLAMDYVEGIDLSKLVRLVGPLDVASACEIVRQAAIGLDYAHQQALIHRDVKPSNLMLTLRGEVRILDLGLALFGAASEALDELTTVGQLMGTLDYMAPEQGDNSHDIDARADVYSLGATLFKLLTATAPYDSPGTRTPLAKMKALATIDAPSVAERRAELPTELVAIVDQALLRDVDDRFASANELADALVPFCESHVLSDLAECGRDLALREDENVPQPPTLPPFVQKAENSHSPANVTPAAEISGRPPGIQRRIASWMLVPLIGLAGIVIWIQTDNATLVVESPSGDIPIEIRTGGKFHSNETLSVGKNELTIRSGTYEIVLPKEYDSLTIENNVFTLERGGEWIARISKKDQVDLPEAPDRNSTDVTKQAFIGSLPTLSGADPELRTAPPGSSPNGAIPGASGPAQGQPGITTSPIPKVTKNSGTLVFSGQTFEEWQRSVLTERNPVELRNAVEALCILGRNNRDAEAASTVLKVVDAYPCQLHQGGGEAELVAAAIRYLRTLDPPSITSAVATAARDGGANTRTLILEFLAAANGGPAIQLLYVGQGEALAAQLRQSSELRDALIDIFAELKVGNRSQAFDLVVENLDEDDPNPTLVAFLESCSRNENPGRIELVAARRLTDLKPSTRLADVFLTYLENRNEAQLQQTVQQPGMGGAAVQNWWSYESEAWLGLAALGRLASGSAGRIAKLIDNVPDSLAKPQTIYLMASPSRVKTRFEIHRQLLPIEILAMIGSHAESTVPAINKVLKTLTGAAPNPQGDYGFDGFHEKLVLERIVGKDARLGVPSPEALTADVEQIRDRPQRLDSALVAIRRITGQEARFEQEPIDANGVRKVPSGMDAGYPGGAMGIGYPGSSPAGMMEGYDSGEYEGIEEYGRDTFEQRVPRLVTYKGKSFAEWADLRNVSLEIPLNDLRDILRGATLLARTPEEQKAAAIIANGVFGHVIRQPTELTPELKNILVTTIEASYAYDPVGVLTPIEDALAQVTPERQAFLLDELLMPVEETKFGYRLRPRAFSRKVVASSQFPNAYDDLVEHWDKHPSVLREAILQAEVHLAGLGQKNSVQLLTRLVKEAYDAATADEASAAVMTDQQMKAAFALAVTKPKNAEVQQQLEKLLSSVLTKPHILRQNPRVQGADSEFADTPTPAKTRPTTMRDLDADRLHAAVTLKLACGHALSEESARQFAELIVQDTERHEVGTFRIVSPPNVPTPVRTPSAFGRMDEHSDEGLAGYAPSGGSGYPGIARGMSGIPVASNGYSGSVPRIVSADSYPGGAMIQDKNQRYSADHGEFSRRLMMMRLLLEAPPEDSDIRNEIGEQLAKTLFKRYPEGFLPAPHDENGNVSVFDLIESEFQSGVRFRKRPRTNEVDLESARFIGTASEVVWNYLPDDRRMQLHKNRVAELQAAQVAATRPKKLYDGRSFEEWLTVIATERSPKRLGEAVTAVAVLGKDGRDTEAANAILGCLASFKCDSINKSDPNVELTLAVRQGLFELDEEVLMPAVANTIRTGNSNQRRFFFKLNSTWLKIRLNDEGPLLKPRKVSAFVAATHDAEGEIRQLATAFLAPLIVAEEVRLEASEADKVRDRLLELLADESAQVPAAVCLSKLAPLTPGLSEVLVDELSRLASQKLPDRTYHLCDVHWALRTLMKEPKLQDELHGQLVKQLDQLDQNRDQWLYHSVNQEMHFTSGSLLIETLVEHQQNPGSTAKLFPILLRKLAGPKHETAATNNPLPAEAYPKNVIGKSYSPILTDGYTYPLPISTFSHLVHTTVANDVNTAAAKWALEQLEKSLPPEYADE